MLLFAQTGMSEPTGWFAIILQGGSFALLAYLIIWGLPALHKQITAERQLERNEFSTSIKAARTDFTVELARGDLERRQERIDFTTTLTEVIANFRAETAAERKVFQEEATAERVACEKHFTVLAGAIEKTADTTMAAIRTSAEQIQQHSLRNQQWAELLKADGEKVKAAMAVAQQKEERP